MQRSVFAAVGLSEPAGLPPDGCEEMKAHIAGCPPCVEFTESLRKTVELCRNYQPTEMPAPLGEGARKELLEAYQKMLRSRKTL